VCDHCYNVTGSTEQSRCKFVAITNVSSALAPVIRWVVESPRISIRVRLWSG